MTDGAERPDPDALLRRVKEEEERARRGKLKIFFGFAPGVGKTYRMLQVARDLVSEQKLDVVVGLVETHRRMDTAALLLGLELMPRRKVEYRDRVLEELDLDAALARRPQVLLVDELAHTNAPGSRHAKRWQDVLELLEHGIDVLTTMNVQHVESLNDVVSQITRIQVRETVPDHVLDEAESMELVDIAPEELLQRLAEGKVYLPEQARRAAEHFFQRGNLLALRELALRRTAQRVDEDVLEYREQHGVQATWPAGERILVCVGPAPSSARLIRTGARMAAGLRCPWSAAYVESSVLAKLSDADRQRLEAHLRVAESLGATVTRLTGRGVSQTLLAHSRKHNVTRILVGKPTHSRLWDRVRGSLLDEIVRGSGDIDVHVISGAQDEGAPPRPRPEPGERQRLGPHLAAAAIVAITLGMTLALRALLGLPDPEMLFLLAVMMSAILFGRGPAVLSAALSVAAYDFFFVEPLNTFAVADHRYVLTFAMMFGVSLMISELTRRLKAQEREALAREERSAVLFALTRDLAAAEQPAQIGEVAARHAAEAFGAQAAVVQAGGEGAGVSIGASIGISIGAWPPELTLDEREHTVASWVLRHESLAGLGTDTLPSSACVCAPLRSSTRVEGALALRPADRQPLRTEQRAFLELFSRQVAGALERHRLASEVRVAALRARTEEMRSSLLSAVSHDLRTPLASITGAATTLRDDGGLPEGTRQELVGSICDEAERLERLVANLLDMTRLESGALSLRRDWVPLEEIFGSALTRLEPRLGERKISVDIDARVPLVLVDPVLLEQVVVNLLENAAKYTPPGSPIELAARRGGDTGEFEGIDHGPGIAEGAEQAVFTKFFRGDHAGVAGAGLGLAICRGIAEAHGGSIRLQRRAGAGAVFCVTLPTGGEPPRLPVGEGELSAAPSAAGAAPAEAGAAAPASAPEGA